MKKAAQILKTIITGIAIGIVNGFFGSAGGILAVEVMEHDHEDDRKAHATALFVILPISVLSAALYIQAGYFQWNVVIFTGLGALAGGILGALLLKKLNLRFIHWIFTAIILITGIRMLF